MPFWGILPRSRGEEHPILGCLHRIGLIEPYQCTCTSYSDMFYQSTGRISDLVLSLDTRTPVSMRYFLYHTPCESLCIKWCSLLACCLLNILSTYIFNAALHVCIFYSILIHGTTFNRVITGNHCRLTMIQSNALA
jgi:hypothetical protein